MKEPRTCLHTDSLSERIPTLSAGDRVLLSGAVYTARDAAHKRLFALLDQNQSLPIRLSASVLYYASPTPAPPGSGLPVGACGPTTSGRMDPFTPRLLKLGLRAMIGKGGRSRGTAEAIAESGAVYFCAIGGAGALIAKHIEKAEVVAFPELGCEAITRLEIQALPLIVGIDSKGGNIFERRTE